MVLAQKQKYRPKEQDRKYRDKSMHLWKQEYIMEKRHSLEEVVLGKLDSYV